MHITEPSSSHQEVKVDMGLVLGYLGGFTVLVIISIIILCLAKNRKDRFNRVQVLGDGDNRVTTEHRPVNSSSRQ